MELATNATDGLSAEWIHGHVLLDAYGDARREREFLADLTVPRGESVVLLAGPAYGRRGIADEVRAALFALFDPPPPGVHTVWLAVDDLGSWPTMLGELAWASGLTVLAPDGGLLFSSGSGIAVGAVSGATGWWRYDPDADPGDAVPAGTRCPKPAWDGVLPEGPVHEAGLRAEDVLAGWLVRPESTPAVTLDDPAQSVPVDVRVPRIVIDGGAVTPSPTALATLLASVPALADGVEIVPAALDCARHGWLAELAETTGRAVVVATCVLAARPTPTADRVGPVPAVAMHALLRQRVDGRQEVLEVVPAPPGFCCEGPSRYRPEDADGGPWVEVVPRGVVVTAETAEPSGSVFDPTGATFDLGRPDEPVDARMLTVATGFRTALDEVRRAGLPVRLVGRWDGAEPDLMARLVPEAVADRLDPVAGGSASAPPRARTLPVVAPLVTVSAEPVSPGAGGAPPPEPPASVTDAPASGPGRDGGPPTDVDGRAGRDPSTGLDPEDVRGLVHPVRDRASTIDEQRRFAESAGERFTAALATANAAMATWPALRYDASPGAKTDLAAVCVHLAGDDADQARADGPSDLLPCLVSGLRRLPTHRRAVLRQSHAVEPARDAALIGRVLRDPGFLGASTELDVIVPGAGVDVLIWPVNARRARELVSRPLEEVIFLAGARFKALAVRESAGDAEPAPTAEGASVAVLVRELAPGEPTPELGPGGTDPLDERDRMALAKLDQALDRRRRTRLRVIDDAVIAARLTSPIAGLDAPAVRWAPEASSIAVGA
ncbi:hypothetical protein HX744_26095 [Pseudonocardia sp. ICBG1122]|nr:hypothetical protein [Pseudonocardia pini]